MKKKVRQVFALLALIGAVGGSVGGGDGGAGDAFLRDGWNDNAWTLLRKAA